MAIIFRANRNKWQVTRTVGGKQYRVLCESKKEAKELDAELRLKQLSSIGISIHYSIHDAFESFLATESRQKTDSSRKADAKFLSSAFCYFTNSSKIHKLGELTIEHLQLFQIHMSESYKWSDTTIAAKCALLKAIFRKAFVTGKIAKDPCEFWKVPRGVSARRRPMTQGEFEKLLSLTMLEWLRPVLHFIRLTGARGASVASLRWSDVDFPRARLYLSSRKGKLKHVKTIAFPMYDTLFQLLARERNKRQEAKSSDHVFLDSNERPLSGHRISSASHRLIKEAGLEGVVLYGLRHALAVDLTEAGVSIEITRQLMGHSNIQQTQTYAQGVSSDSLRESVKLIRDTKEPDNVIALKKTGEDK